MSSLKIFVVDDERIVRVSIADEFRDAGYSVLEFADAVAALNSLREQEVDVIFTDIKMPQMDEIEFLLKIKEFNPDITVVVMTSYASYPLAVDAIKKGAYDFITKPFQMDLILLMLERIKDFRAVSKDNVILRSQVQTKYDFSSFIGGSEESKRIFDLVKIIADSKSTALIEGETGTGKELITNIIHFNSNRKNQALIKVNCAILLREVFESELFGHCKGAFTGADKDKEGRFEIADGGTLYLDDIDDIPIDLQVKLLRVLEESEIERVGCTETIKVDVLVIASTKRDLRKLVDEGKFREDLYYRLNVFPIILEPLRDKRDDIPHIFNHFLDEFSQGRKITVEKEVINILKNYPWPGNVRELRNIAERLILLAKNNLIKATMVPNEIAQPPTSSLLNHIGEKTLFEAVQEFEINAIKTALIKFTGNKTKAAKYLGIPPTTLHTKLSKYEIN